jgi:DNA-binding ferritin-like protein (Dps family)
MFDSTDLGIDGKKAGAISLFVNRIHLALQLVNRYIGLKMRSSKILAVILTAMWLSACTHMGSPEPSQSEKEKSAENTSESRAKPPQTAEPNPQKSQEKTQANRPPSQKETASKTEKTAENISEDGTTPSEAANASLEKARENLRTSRETENRIAADLENLKKSNNASPEAVKDYEEYLSRVKAMTAENRKIVEQMETAYKQHTPGATHSNPVVSNKLDKMYDPNIPEEQTVDEVAALDQEFNESLAQFDDKLLKEMDEIRAGSTEKLQDLAQEAADAAKRLRDKGVAVDTSGTQKETSESSRQTETNGDSADTPTASRNGSSTEGKGASQDNRRRTDYEDDDIVARQLREAAENETDPELKEKLWKEYEEYKKSSP